MSESSVSLSPLSDFPLWEKMRSNRVPVSLNLEITARCNNNCRHCYINLPAGDKSAQDKELSLDEIKTIADEAAELGAFWCLLTGGEPFLRRDFSDIYLYLKKKGFLVSVYTNATLITEKHVSLLKKYPPRNMEVSVYGVTEETYEQVTRKPGSFNAFMRGLNLLLEAGVKIDLKAMALRSTFHEMPEIARFCRERTRSFFRFDPLLHLRYDGDPVRNEEIKSERLSPEEIVALERSDPERFQAMQDNCDSFTAPGFSQNVGNFLFRCGIGMRIYVSYNGLFRVCTALWHPDYLYDLRKGSLTDAWHNFGPKVRTARSDRKELLETCNVCSIPNLCLWCPAHAYLETGELDAPVDYFCKVAHARARMLREAAKERRA